ncbi:MAG: hypothetical protein KKF62_16165 [Bacteroidetes bacterium]|nr:hypothetical protein [Bacteroidota bacterium]MBU1115726.1 hypothetical protein [Bacteroidota bacterium]MBU1800525.1 hypothetical protein [Bacteroidota bacterium]
MGILKGEKKKEVRDYFVSSQDRFYFDLEYSPSINDENSDRRVIPTVILIGNETASAAEDFLISAKNQKHITTIGENTFGSSGQSLKFKLPVGGSARVCTLQLTNPDGSQFIGIGIEPDIEVKTTLKDYLNKVDPVLLKGLEHLNTQIKINK